MLLRASGEREGLNCDVDSVVDARKDPGVPHGKHLRALTEAAISGDWLALAEYHPRAEAAMGRQQVVDALVVAAAFNGITRVADATGIPLDESTDQNTRSLREQTGIQQFDYAAKSARYD